MFNIHSPLKFLNLVIVHTLDFWYMIKNKEATDSAALEFCHILNKFAAQLDECLSFKDFGLRQNSRASFRRKLGESAICSKYEQNFTASLSVAYLFFIIYLKSKVWTITRLENLRWSVCFTLLVFIINICLPLQKSKTNNVQHTHLSVWKFLILYENVFRYS